MNHLLSGIYATSMVIRGDNSAELEQLKNEYITRYRPQDPIERDCIDTMIRCTWINRRLDRIYCQLHEDKACEIDSMEAIDVKYGRQPHPETIPGRAHEARSDEFGRIQRNRSALNRDFSRALKDFRALQADRRKYGDPAEPDAPTLTSTIDTANEGLSFEPANTFDAPAPQPEKRPPSPAEEPSAVLEPSETPS